MTTNDIIAKARRLLQDTESPYHWSDASIKSDIQYGVRALHKIRPETRYVGGLLVDEVTLPALNTTVISIDPRFEDCLVYYAAYMAYSDDCTDSVSKQLADDFFAKFNTLSLL